MTTIQQNYKPVVLNNSHSIQELKTTLKHASDEAEKTRLRVLILIKQGKTKTGIAEEFGIERGTIIDWIKRYNSLGLNGLHSNLGGRKEGNPKWDTEIFSSLVKEIDRQGKYWSIPLMRQWIKEKYKQDIPEQTVWYHMDKQGYSYKSARPHPYLGNKEKQESFKKRAWEKN